MKNKTYNIYALGCKVNNYDSSALAKEIEARGIKRVKQNADLALVYSCSVTGSAITKNRQMIKKARNENPDAFIVLAGCWPRVEKLDKDILGVDFLIQGDELNDFWCSIERINEKDNELELLKEVSKARYFIKVQDGCEQFCSYCIIPYARGPLRSRDRLEILSELTQAIKKGYKEIVISGIHLGLYGHSSNYKLLDLLKDILGLEGLGRIRLSSIELNEVSDKIVALIKNNQKFCKHLHIPLQSGNDKILKLMNRPYDTGGFRKKINKIRNEVPDIAISTDVIVGFPGEGENDFIITKDFIMEMKFSMLHVFSFSAHKKTPAFSFPEQIKRDTILKRAKEIRKLGVVLESEFKKKFKGKHLQVVLENFKKGRAKMKTEYYFDIDCELNSFKENEVGQLIDIVY